MKKKNKNTGLDDTNKKLNISDVINSVGSDNEIFTPQNYIVVENDENDNLKLLEIATTLPRALDIRDFYEKQKNGEEYPLIHVHKLLDNDSLILDELKHYL
jgi:hypothetical protein